MNYSELFERANKNISTIKIGQLFLAKDLFPGTEWNRLKKGEKLSFGKQFKNAVLDGKYPSVEYIGKAENNSAQYKKINEADLI
jgi:hypothetical protein